MTYPTEYTEATLKTFMVTQLGSVATVLGITTALLAEAVNDVLTRLEIDDIADAADMAAVRAIATARAWEYALAEASVHVDVNDGEASFSSSQMLDGIKANLAQAERAASEFDATMQLTITTLDYVNDPYQIGNSVTDP